MSTRKAVVQIDPLESRVHFAVGDGLLGTYFDGTALTQMVATRVDPVVNFNWGTVAPAGAEGVGADTFSVRWTGKVQTGAAGIYSFFAKGDDGARVWVNGRLIVNGWTASTIARERGGKLTLAANTQYDIRVEYFDGTGAAQFNLLWAGPSITKQTIPTASLFSGATITPTPTATPAPTATPTPTPTPTLETDPYADRPQPAPGGTRYIVDPAGPISTVQAAANLVQPGDVVLIKPGVYHEFVDLRGSGTAARRITFASADPANPGIIDGTGRPQILDAANDYITLQDLTFQNASNMWQQPAVQIGSYAIMTDCIVQNTDGQGLIVYGNGAVLTRVIAQYNGEEGITGVTCSNVLVKDCITRYNNNGKVNPVWAGGEHAILGSDGLWYVDATWQAGGGKWVRTDRVTLDGVQSYGNRGPGIWFDYMNTNVVVRNCTVNDNIATKPDRFYESFGINIELCEGPVLVENNVVGQHAYAAIVVQSSRKVTVRNNTVTGAPILLLDWSRGANYTLQDITVTRNRLFESFVWADGGTWNTNSGQTKRLTIDSNTYVNDSTSDRLFRLVSTNYSSLAQVRSTLRFELNGVVTIISPGPFTYRFGPLIPVGRDLLS